MYQDVKKCKKENKGCQKQCEKYVKNCKKDKVKKKAK